MAANYFIKYHIELSDGAVSSTKTVGIVKSLKKAKEVSYTLKHQTYPDKCVVTIYKQKHKKKGCYFRHLIQLQDPEFKEKCEIDALSRI